MAASKSRPAGRRTVAKPRKKSAQAPAKKRVRNSAKPAGRYPLRPIGRIRSSIKTRAEAPRQGAEGAPDAWLEIEDRVAAGLDGIQAGDELMVITWLHRGRRGVLKVIPRNYRRGRRVGVFTTRSPDRPNPLGLHPVVVRRIEGSRLLIGPIEAIDKTPVVDIKPLSARPLDLNRGT
jgi:tRNA-Thr(GGU) m(6)t(6)A37 methyltransferase TsaA